MSLSKSYTAFQMWSEATQDVRVGVNSSIYVDRLNLINSCVDATFNTLQPLMIKSYQRSAVITKSYVDKRDVGGSATFNPTTNILHCPAISTGFTVGDVGRYLVGVQAGTASWFGTVVSVIGSNDIVISANSPIASTVTLLYVFLPPTTINDDIVNLAGLRINRVIAPVNITLESSLSTTVRPETVDGLKSFNVNSDQNRKTIVFALEGETLLLRKGYSLTSYGTLTMHYPAMPTPVTSNNSMVDLPDGSSITLAITALRAKIQKRIGQPVNVTQEIQSIVASLFQSLTPELQTKKVNEIESLL